MTSQGLRLTFVSIDISFPNLPRFSGKTFADFYSEIHDRHPFESIEIQGDSGAVLETEGERRLEIRRDGVALQEQVRVDWELIKRGTVDLLKPRPTTSTFNSSYPQI